MEEAEIPQRLDSAQSLNDNVDIVRLFDVVETKASRIVFGTIEGA